MHRLLSRASAAAVILASTAVLGAQSAAAADLTRPVYKAPVAAPLYNWSGFYAGVNVGWGWSENSSADLVDRVGFGLGVALGQVPLSLGLKRDGVLGGGQIGYNWQTGSFVLGLETDFQGSDIHGSGGFFYPGPFAPVQTTVNNRLDWFGTVRGRVGFSPTPQALLYVTGGLAYGHINSSASFVVTPAALGNGSVSVSETKAGWTIGAGTEWAFAANWSVKAEYLYLDLGNTTLRLYDQTTPGTYLDYKFEHRDHIVRLGVNYKFGG